MNETDVTRIGIAALSTRLGVDRSTIWRWYRAGKFPQPHYLGAHRAWILAEIEAWERERMASPLDARNARSKAERLRRSSSTDNYGRAA